MRDSAITIQQFDLAQPYPRIGHGMNPTRGIVEMDFPTKTTATSGNRQQWLTILSLCVVVFLLRLILIATSPVGLSHDEAYYWDWSREPALGYYSKPPMVAWLIAVSTRIGGDNEFFVRLPAAVLATIGMCFVYLLGRQLFSHRVGIASALLVAACPGSVALGFLITIDAPLLCFWCGSLWMLAIMISDSRWSWPACAGGVMLTGCGLLSKQTMLAIYPLTLVFIATSGYQLRHLQRPQLYVWGIGSLLFLIPVVIWNSENGWTTLSHTQEHFTAEPATLAERVKDSAEFWASQFGVYSPVTLGLLIVVGYFALRFPRRLDVSRRFLLCYSILPLLGIWILSLKQQLEPNWAGPFYPAGLVLVASELLSKQGRHVPHLGEKWLRRSVLTGAATVVALVVAIYVISPRNVAGTGVDPLVRLRGWQQFADAVDHLRDEDAEMGRELIIVTAGRAEVAELSFYLPDQPTIHLWRRDEQVRSQYDLRPAPNLESAETAILITPFGVAPPAVLTENFSLLQKLPDISIPLGGKRSLQYSVYLAQPESSAQASIAEAKDEPPNSTTLR